MLSLAQSFHGHFLLYNRPAPSFGGLEIRQGQGGGSRGCCASIPFGLSRAPLSAVEELPEGLRSAHPAHMATKWVDYSNKYGFGYLLSNGSTAVLFPDGTHMAFCPQHQ